ncbi:MAG: hypothetical protein E7I47_12615 [Clostridium sp.]|uniref:hypothetical protein n=1 Tax=Clostridium sp. TaxID=1506 RepID=UPI002912B4CA|nr:hypothetical protein [Clostridium sp.]MDU4320141.1 hypothetical protein [Clostridium sp.]
MTYYRKRKGKQECKDLNLLIQYERLFHYENLLIKKIDKLEERYESKIDSNKVISIISLLITILGYTNDVVGMKMIQNIPNYKEVIFIIIYFLPHVMLFRSVIKLSRFKKKFEIYNMKDEYGQKTIFSKYIVSKINENRELNRKINDTINSTEEINKNLFKYYNIFKNQDKIIFYKSDLKRYINDYLIKLDKNISYDISHYLCEIIILRYLIDGQIAIGKVKEQLEFTIDENNVMEIKFMSSRQ